MFAAHGTQADKYENGLLLQSINAPVGKYTGWYLDHRVFYE